MNLKQFVALWDEDTADSFGRDRPNASLAIDGPQDFRQSVVILERPELNGDGISFKVNTVEGTIPPSFGHAALFVDCIGIVEVCNQNRSLGIQ